MTDAIVKEILLAECLMPLLPTHKPGNGPIMQRLSLCFSTRMGRVGRGSLGRHPHPLCPSPLTYCNHPLPELFFLLFRLSVMHLKQ